MFAVAVHQMEERLFHLLLCELWVTTANPRQSGLTHCIAEIGGYLRARLRQLVSRAAAEEMPLRAWCLSVAAPEDDTTRAPQA